MMQNMSDTSWLKHHFLLAMPGLTPDYFGGSIIYLCEHNADGAMGLIVNRPTDFSLMALLEQLDIEAPSTPEGLTLEGGPVQTDRGFMLHTDDRTFESSLDLGHGLMLSTARHLLEAVARGEGPRNYLIAFGYSGWGPGQLEQELGQNAWLSCPATLEVLFEVPYEQRVAKAAALLGIDFRLMAHQAGHA
jgi:putative transcriptional regulator